MVTESTTEIVDTFRYHLFLWGRDNICIYPWRWSNDAYHILVAEFMLHRTQAKQVVPVYTKFVAHYPTLKAFAQGDVARAQDILKPLGLLWRSNGLLVALMQLWHNYKEVPLNPDQLKAIDGIGPYIAGATICFAANIPAALIDTNTVRVIGRIWGLDLSGEARRRKTIIDAITYACDPINPRDYYYALIDFAHSICKVRNPDCLHCPLLDLPCQHGKLHTLYGGQ